MSEETRNACRLQAESTRTLLEEVWAVIDGDEVDCPHCEGDGMDEDGEECPECEGLGLVVPDDYEGQDPYEYLDELPLEVVWEKGEEFAVVLGAGGPHVEITGGGRSGGYALHVYWGGEHVTLGGESITRTGEYFREMREEGE